MLERAYFLIIVLPLLALSGCGALKNEPIGPKTAVPPSPSTDISPTSAVTALPETAPTTQPSATPPPPATAVITPSPIPPDLSIDQNDVSLYPAPQIYAGDKVTFQIWPYVPPNVDATDVSITVFVDGRELGDGALNEHNLSGDAFGLVKWGWDTSGQVGEHQIQVALDVDDIIQIGDENPDNNWISLPVTVYGRDLLPETEANATWVTAETDCCHVYVVSGTAAYRDLPQLLVEVETAVQEAASRLDEPPQQPINIYFIDRIIGQGGYAGSDLVISYLDRDYGGINLNQLLVHETVHIIDRQFAPQRISLLAEGLAVWVSGGHYKPEDIDQRAAALLSLDLYVPLAELANDFYPVQHEIGYLQAASFVNYLVDLHGWSRFRQFYSDVTLEDAPTPAEALDLNLQIYYNKTLTDMEADWLAYLDGLGWDETAVTDLQTTLLQYNTMRRYQSLYDPTAYFLHAWLPYPKEVRSHGNPADLSRHPESEINITLEVMLQAASEALQAGNYHRAAIILESVGRVLDNNGLFQDPLALNYHNIVHLAAASGYEVQKVILSGDHAVIWVTDDHSNVLTALNASLKEQTWTLVN